ncbi:MAG: cell division protein FtsA [Fusobacterium sp.]|nr:cell division protein FtsA [Fusobacterium sp.]
MISRRDSIVKTALDIGNMKVKAVIGELSDDGSQLKVLGYAEAPTKGMKKSIIENPEELSQSIAYALGKLRDQTGENIEKVSIGISGEAIKSRTTNMKYQFDEKEITEKEVETLFRMAAHELLSGKERILKKEIYNIRVDNSGIIKNPIGTVGKEIQGDIHLIYTDEAEVEKLVEVVNRAGLEVEDILLNAYASAKAVLDDEDRRMGVALIDIGEGSTDIIVFKNNKLIYTKTIPLGGMHYVSDISYMLQISKHEAFEILSKLINKEVHGDHIYCGTNKTVAIDKIKEIIDARTGDIINFIAQTIEESGFNGYLGKGLVLTGGAVAIDGLPEKINKKTGYVVRKVLPTAFRGLEDVDSSQATVIGIFTEIMENEYIKIQNRLNSPEPEIQEELDERTDDNLENLEKLLEETQKKEPKEKKDGVLTGIKSWFSNFI